MYADVVRIDPTKGVTLASEHKSGLSAGRRKLVRTLVAVLSLTGMLWAAGSWMASITNNVSTVGFQAARNIDKASFDRWFYGELVRSGYEGKPFDTPTGAIELSVGEMYGSVLSSLLIDPDTPATWDITPLIAYGDGDVRVAVLPLDLAAPFDVSVVTRPLAAMAPFMGILTLLLFVSVLWLAKDGRVQAVGWVLRMVGWRWALVGGAATVWILWTTSKVDPGAAVDGQWLAHNLSMEVAAWDPIPYAVLGILGIIMAGGGFVLKHQT